MKKKHEKEKIRNDNAPNDKWRNNEQLIEWGDPTN